MKENQQSLRNTSCSTQHPDESLGSSDPPGASREAAAAGDRPTRLGHFQMRGHYEMIEKAGLYWHFVDLVWVFVFLCFYLI